MDATQPAWAVQSQAEVIQPQQSGPALQGKSITVKILSSGTIFTVFVPDSQYTADNVKAAIAKQYAEVMAVDGLTGS